MQRLDDWDGPEIENQFHGETVPCWTFLGSLLLWLHCVGRKETSGIMEI